MQHRDKIILQKIISELDIGMEIVGDLSKEEFLADEKVKRAAGMTVINIGELVKNITDEMRQTHKEVPWKEAAGMRDLTAHKYQTLRMEDVYNTVIVDFGSFKKQLENILKEES